jgi:hypothetical protein
MKLIAQNPVGTIVPPPQVQPIIAGSGAQGLTLFISNLMNLIIIVSGLVFLFMILLGGYEWMTSGGSKEGLGKARGRIMHGIIGFAIVALAAVIAQIVGSILNIKIF